MAEKSKRFDFDSFDRLCRDVLPDYDEQDVKMAAEDLAREEVERWADYDRVFYPGEIGGVVTRLSMPLDATEPEPPEAA